MDTITVSREHVEMLTKNNKGLVEQNEALTKRLLELWSIVLGNRYDLQEVDHNLSVSCIWLSLADMHELEGYLNTFDLSVTLAEPYGGIFTAKDRIVTVVAKKGDGGHDWAAYVSTPINLSEWRTGRERYGQLYRYTGEYIGNILKYGTKVSRSFGEYLFPSYANQFEWRR